MVFINIIRKKIVPFLSQIQELEKNEHFTISTKYKILKIKEILLSENELNISLLNQLIEKYGGTIEENGDITFKQELALPAQEEFNSYYNEQVNLPDVYFSIDEFPQDMSWEALEFFLPFIK